MFPYEKIYFPKSGFSEILLLRSLYWWILNTQYSYWLGNFLPHIEILSNSSFQPTCGQIVFLFAKSGVENAVEDNILLQLAQQLVSLFQQQIFLITSALKKNKIAKYFNAINEEVKY